MREKILFFFVSKSILNKVTIRNYTDNCCMTTGVDAFQCVHNALIIYHMNTNVLTVNIHNDFIVQSTKFKFEKSICLANFNTFLLRKSKNRNRIVYVSCEPISYNVWSSSTNTNSSWSKLIVLYSFVKIDFSWKSIRLANTYAFTRTRVMYYFDWKKSFPSQFSHTKFHNLCTRTLNANLLCLIIAWQS